MKRLFRLSLISLATTLLFAAAPFAIASASAQDFPIIEELDLTEDQREQVQAIFQDFRNEMDGILTDEQQEQFQEVYRELRDVREAAASIENLTDAQREDIRALRQATRQDLNEVLTEEQRSEVRSIIQERRQEFR